MIDLGVFLLIVLLVITIVFISNSIYIVWLMTSNINEPVDQQPGKRINDQFTEFENEALLKDEKIHYEESIVQVCWQNDHTDELSNNCYKDEIKLLKKKIKNESNYKMSQKVRINENIDSVRCLITICPYFEHIHESYITIIPKKDELVSKVEELFVSPDDKGLVFFYKNRLYKYKFSDNLMLDYNELYGILSKMLGHHGDLVDQLRDDKQKGFNRLIVYEGQFRTKMCFFLNLEYILMRTKEFLVKERKRNVQKEIETVGTEETNNDMRGTETNIVEREIVDENLKEYKKNVDSDLQSDLNDYDYLSFLGDLFNEYFENIESERMMVNYEYNQIKLMIIENYQKEMLKFDNENKTNLKLMDTIYICLPPISGKTTSVKLFPLFLKDGDELVYTEDSKIFEKIGGYNVYGEWRTDNSLLFDLYKGLEHIGVILTQSPYQVPYKEAQQFYVLNNVFNTAFIDEKIFQDSRRMRAGESCRKTLSLYNCPEYLNGFLLIEAFINAWVTVRNELKKRTINDRLELIRQIKYSKGGNLSNQDVAIETFLMTQNRKKTTKSSLKIERKKKIMHIETYRVFFILKRVKSEREYLGDSVIIKLTNRQEVSKFLELNEDSQSTEEDKQAEFEMLVTNEDSSIKPITNESDEMYKSKETFMFPERQSGRSGTKTLEQIRKNESDWENCFNGYDLLDLVVKKIRDVTVNTFCYISLKILEKDVWFKEMYSNELELINQIMQKTNEEFEKYIKNNIELISSEPKTISIEGCLLKIICLLKEGLFQAKILGNLKVVHQYNDNEIVNMDTRLKINEYTDIDEEDIMYIKFEVFIQSLIVYIKQNLTKLLTTEIYAEKIYQDVHRFTLIIVNAMILKSMETIGQEEMPRLIHLESDQFFVVKAFNFEIDVDYKGFLTKNLKTINKNNNVIAVDGGEKCHVLFDYQPFPLKFIDSKNISKRITELTGTL